MGALLPPGRTPADPIEYFLGVVTPGFALMEADGFPAWHAESQSLERGNPSEHPWGCGMVIFGQLPFHLRGTCI